VVFDLPSKKYYIFINNCFKVLKLSGNKENRLTNNPVKFQVVSIIWRSYVKFWILVTFFLPYPVLSGTSYEKSIESFASRINRTLAHHKIKLDIVKCNGSSIGKLLFRNNVKSTINSTCSRRCDVCSNDLRNENTQVESPTNGRSYPIDTNLSCSDRGIYSISCSCLSLYVGKTTTKFNQRFKGTFSEIKDICSLRTF